MRVAGHLSAAFVLAMLASSSSARAEDETEMTERQHEEPGVAFAKAMSGLQLKTQANDELWGLGSAKWSVDLDRGIIEFRNNKGWSITAPVQVIGTYDTRDGTFMWGWDHPSVPKSNAVAAELVHEFGKLHGLDLLTTHVAKMKESQAWEFTALADYLSNGNGAYRGPTGTTLVYMTFGKVTISGQ
jgi:hypothetical protein